MNARRILIHYHIYKNAGSSIDVMLKQCFGQRWGTIEGDTPLDVLSRERLEAALLEHPDWCAVSSHLARPPVPPGGLAVIFLRHPLLRARSVYAYARSDHTQPDHHAAVASSFRDYVAWAMGPGRAIVPIFDYQTYHLSSASFRGPYGAGADPVEMDLLEAERLLQSIGLCGVVEDFEFACARFEAAYRPWLPDLRLPGAHENRTETEPMAPEQRLARMEDELGPALHQSLLAVNTLDLRLHARARRILRGA